ncbi:MAG TPA: MmcQ/YjbR family DNA-binding protein [Candidatus Limiplasma sp.]|nr:MmcQ/YjbR family DNA-binding protein [Candidatus Limiplasma sp.]HPS81468.1 MmcQ/YjbR family DNA-binding protein [Candidatus Limiplasma sp.]
MTAQQITDYCLGKPGAWVNCPFGPDLVCARIGKRIFAEIFLTRPWVTLKCDPVYALALRQEFPETIRRGYHCPTPQQPYNNTVTLDGTVPDARLWEMIDHSYARALQSLPKAERLSAVSAGSECKKADENPEG